MPGAVEPLRTTADQACAGFGGWIDVGCGVDRQEWEQNDGILSRPGAQISAATDCDVCARDGWLVLLQGAPSLPEGTVDAAMLLQRVQREGVPVLSLLRGRYSAVVIDPRNQLTLQTDRFAIHPLCWLQDRGRIAFADRCDRVPLESGATIDPQALFHYLYFHVIPAPRTIFEGVRRLSCAQRLTASAGQVAIETFWTPVFAAEDRADEHALAEHFRDTLRAAVSRAAGAADAGAFLSGGTDSSTIAGMLRAIKAQPVDAYSIGFDADGYDEMHYARIAARHFDLRHHAHYLTPAELKHSVSTRAGHFEQPFGNSSWVPAFRCAALAAADGRNRLLAGDGGDELFGGNTRYAKQQIFEIWSRLPSLLQRAGAQLADRPLAAQLPLLRKFASYVRQASVPLPARAESYNLLHRIGVAHLLSREMLSAVDPSQPAREQQQTWDDIDAAALINRMLAYDWQYTLADNDLPKVRNAAALAGIDVAFPMLDDDVVDLSLKLPASWKVRRGRLRPFFKRALSDFLPAEVIAKRKHGFGMPFGVWLQRDAGLAALVDDHLESLAQRGIFAPTALRDLRSERLSQHAAYYGEMIWLALMLEAWLRQRAPQFRL